MTVSTRPWGRVPRAEKCRARIGDLQEPRDIAYIDPRSPPWRGYLFHRVSERGQMRPMGRLFV